MARTSTQLTQAELDAYDQYAIDNGLVLEGAIGRQNGDLLGGFIVNQMKADITPQTLEAAVKHLRDKLTWKPQDQLDYEKIFASLSPTDQNAFLAWRNPARMVQSYRNSYRLLRFLKDRRMAVNDSNIRIAIANLGVALEFTPVPQPDNGIYRPDGKIDHAKKSNPKSNEPEDDRRYVNGRTNHAHNPQFTAEVHKSVQDAAWKAKAEAVRGNRHSESAAIQRMFVSGPNGEIDWKATYTARDRAASGARGSI